MYMRVDYDEVFNRLSSASLRATFAPTSKYIKGVEGYREPYTNKNNEARPKTEKPAKRPQDRTLIM